MNADLLSDAIGKAEADAIGRAKALADRIDAKYGMRARLNLISD